jgi:hypothetical protein
MSDFRFRILRLLNSFAPLDELRVIQWCMEHNLIVQERRVGHVRCIGNVPFAIHHPSVQRLILRTSIADVTAIKSSLPRLNRTNKSIGAEGDVPRIECQCFHFERGCAVIQFQMVNVFL